MKGQLQVQMFSSSTVENWRYGRSTPKGENLTAIKVLTGMTTDQILGIS